MSNLPPDYGITPPYDNPEEDMFEHMIYDAMPIARAHMANAISELLWDAAKEAIEEQNVSAVWEGWFDDNKFELIESIHDELYQIAKKMWEQEDL